MRLPSKKAVYDQLPQPVKPVAKHGYYQIESLLNRVYFILSDRKTDQELHSEFVSEFFSSNSEYDGYVEEFNKGSAAYLRNEGLKEYQELTDRSGLSGIGLDRAQDYYAVVRKLEPSIIVETGVCNGISTLSILLALQQNGSGKLYSIDYPFRADESLDEFRQETFEGYGGAAIPSDKDPGWIIPDELRSAWDLTIGKSQRELPRLITELETIDMFAHDSEHSHPCMMFEFELAYEWIRDDGVILSDDISWNSAFSVFTEVRKPKCGRLSNNVGYIKKSNAD
jgi:predicted O-methyltransferase YrrM